MLTTLIESQRTRGRNRGATALSVLAHATIIALVATVTARVSDGAPARPPDATTLFYVHPVTARPPEDSRASTSRARTAEPIMTPVPPTTVIEMPRTIPTGLLPVDFSLPPVDPSEFGSGSPAPGGDAGVESSPSSGGFGALTALQVDRAVIPLAGNREPAYPSLLRAGGVDGEVIAQFVVDSTGRVDMSTFRAVRATDELFVESVRRALSEWRFRPAEADGRRVRQLVEMPLLFRMR